MKLLKKRGKNLNKLQTVIDLLRHGFPLPAKYRNHPLSGNWKHHMECHIEPDSLLIYQMSDEALYLVESGSHTDLFE